jgi:hypothetical protein
MTKHLVLVFAVLFLSSCATLFSKREHYIEVTSNSSSASVNINDVNHKLPAKILVKRSKQRLKVFFSNDSLQKELLLKPRLNSKFLFGNLCFYPPFSYAIDFTNDKRFGYKKNVFIKVKDTTVKISAIPLETKIVSLFNSSFKDDSKKLKFHFSMPWLNGFSFKTFNNRRIYSFGFIGVAGGFDYFYTKDRFVSFRADAIADYFAPIFIPLAHDDGDIRTSAVNFSLLNSKKLNKFIYGYGLNYAQNYWSYNSGYYYNEGINTIYNERIRFVSHNIGLNLNSCFQITDNFYIGVVYRPSFVTFDSGPKFIYEHALSLDLSWKINLLSFKKRNK